MGLTIRAHRWLIMLIMASCCLSALFAQTTTTTAKMPADNTSVVDTIGEGKIDWSNENIRAHGIGFAPAFATTPAQMAIFAREAALVAAERNLLKAMNGVHVTAETTVENLLLAQDSIKASVSGFLKGAVIVSEHPFGENGYEIELALHIYGDKASLTQSVDLANQFKISNPGTTVVPASDNPVAPAAHTPPTPIETQPPAKEQPAAYTGLLIDCRGLGLAHSLCPRILDQTSTNLWSTLTVSAALVNERGIAGYYQSEDDPAIAERVGKHPLVITALRVTGGKTYKTDVVISPADAELVRAENAKSFFLDKLHVAFLVDKETPR